MHASVYMMYRLTFKIRRALVGNKIVDNSDVVGESPAGCSNYIFILYLTHDLNMLHKGNCIKRRELFKLRD